MRTWTGGQEEYPWLAALVGMTVVGFVTAAIAGAIGGIPAHSVAQQNVMTIFVMTPVTLFVVVVALAARAAMLRIPNPIGEAIAFVRRRAGTPAGAAACLLPILVVPWLMGAFGTLKMLMPRVVDFSWDDRFAAVDRILFLGWQPWEITHFLMGNAVFTHIIDYIYSLWVALLFFVVLIYALFAPRYDRARFFLSFGASWLLIGVVGAYVFASVGPCFTAQIGASSAPEFAALMDRLRGIDAQSMVGAVRWQDKLWTNHSTAHYALGMGISAMPSMHNAITWLYALSLKRAPRPYRIAAWAFVAFIFVGSIHLGWHYAVDGLVSFAMMSGIWWAAGRFLERTGTAAALLHSDQGSSQASDGRAGVAAA
jgi:hypothetical protein